MSITFLEFVSVFGGLSIAIVGAWINSKISIAKLQVEVQLLKEEVESEKKANNKNFEKLENKIDQILNKLNGL